MLWLSLITQLLLLLSVQSIDEDRCNYLFHKYLTKYHKTPVPLSEAQLLYFLHIPRTAGRSFFFCFLKRGTTPAKRCPKSYDHLRVDPNLPDCWLLSSHDDYSIVPMLAGKVAVATQLRNPIDRIISAYEFAIEIASRERRRFQLGLPPVSRPPSKTVTTNVWPWSLLVPHMVQDMKAKLGDMKARAKRQPTNAGRKLEQTDETAAERLSLPPMPPLDPYNNSLVQSLHEFVSSPIAAELLHNGAFFQILGITNYSHNPSAAELRQCSFEHAGIRQNLMSLAKEYLSKFVHVGTTDLLYESVAAAGVSLELPIHGPSYVSNTDIQDFKHLLKNSTLSRRRLHARRQSSSSKSPRSYSNSSIPESVIQHCAHTGQDLNGQSVTKEMLAGSAANVLASRTVADQSPTSKSKFSQLSSFLSSGAWSNVWSRLLQSQPGAGSSASDSSQDQTAATSVSPAGLSWGDAGKSLQRYLHDASSKFQWLRKSKKEKAQMSKVPSLTDLPIPSKDLAVETARRGRELGHEFMTCTNRRQTKATEMRNRGLANMKNEQGQGLIFSKKARKEIPAATIDLIRSLNQQDMELYEYATQLLKAKRKQYTDEGRLRELPTTPQRAPLLTDRVGLPMESSTTGNDSGELR